MSKKVMIVTENWAGSGHRMAAAALQQAIELHSPATVVTTIDGLQTVSPALRFLSQAAYRQMLRRSPQLWQQLYQRNQFWGGLLKKPLGRVLRQKLLAQVLNHYQPDTVIATHAYLISALAEAKGQARSPYKLVSVATDFHLNHFWVHPHIDAYIVANEKVAEEVCHQHQIAPEMMYPYGIPLRSAFYREQERMKSEWRKQLGLKEKQFTVLISGGEGGHGKIRLVLERLMQIGRPMQILIMTGKNQELYQDIVRLLKQHATPHTLYVLGYLHDIWAYLGAADVLITKAGGLTCSEALAMHTPMILYQSLPGQELKNSQFLCAQGLAREANSVDEVARILERWYAHQDERQAIEQRMVGFAKPDAAYRLASFILML